jgi:hypothetical protein
VTLPTVISRPTKPSSQAIPYHFACRTYVAEKEQAVSGEPRETPGYVHNPYAALDAGSHACPLRGRAMKLDRRSVF